MNWKEYVKEAEERIASFDKIDGEPISAKPIVMALDAVIAAIECGGNCGKWEMIADALIMLGQIRNAQ